jgi:glucokinase
MRLTWTGAATGPQRAPAAGRLHPPVRVAARRAAARSGAGGTRRRQVSAGTLQPNEEAGLGQEQRVVVGLDNGGTTNNATVLDAAGRFLVEGLVETPSRVREGPAVAVEALAESFEQILRITGTSRHQVLGIGLDTPGPASAAGVISVRGAVNFANPDWRGFDIRGAVETRIGLPVVYNNDANAASLYAHHAHYGADAAHHSSVSLIVGTGLGGGVVERGQVVRGAAGMAGELGHIRIPVDGLLAEGQPVPACNCGQPADAESFASLSGIAANLLPYWLGRYPGHPLESAESLRQAAKLVRGYGEAGDPMAREIFRQQAIAMGRLFTIAANFTDPDIYFLGGGVVEAAPEFRDWFLDLVREHTDLRSEQAEVESFALVPDLDMAGARGAAIAASDALRGGRLSLPV